jgi:tetratricopeptide (TPR) repeat protein
MSRKNTIEIRAARAFGLKKYPLAIRHLNDLLECVGENPHTLHMLALCHSRQNEDLLALAFARRALQADDRHLESLKLLARLHFTRGEHAEARMFVARALEHHRAHENQPSPRWLSAALARMRMYRGDSHHASSAGRNEHRQWLEWAEAYMAAPDKGDGEDS